MTSRDEPEPTKPEAAEVERTVSQQAKQQPESAASPTGKPNEGVRPEGLTSENDGGAEG